MRTDNLLCSQSLFYQDNAVFDKPSYYEWTSVYFTCSIFLSLLICAGWFSVWLPSTTCTTHWWISMGHLSNTAIWQCLPTPQNNLTICAFRSIKRQYLQQDLQQRMCGYELELFVLCPPKLSIDPILWIPLTHQERSYCILWCLGWLLGSRPRPYPIHHSSMLTRPHAIKCFRMHRRWCLLLSIPDPLPFFA